MGGPWSSAEDVDFTWSIISHATHAMVGPTKFAPLPFLLGNRYRFAGSPSFRAVQSIPATRVKRVAQWQLDNPRYGSPDNHVLCGLISMCTMVFYAHSRPGSDKALWQSVEEHLEAVAAVTSRLGGKIGLSHAGELIGLAHDLGKYSEVFQQYLCKVAGDAAMEREPDPRLKGSVDHSAAGAQIIARSLDAAGRGFAAEPPSGRTPTARKVHSMAGSH